MPEKLTDLKLRKSRSGAQLADTIVPGLRFTKRDSGTGTFWYRYNVVDADARKRQKRVTIGTHPFTSLEDARRLCLEQREVRKAHGDPQAVKRAKRAASVRAGQEAATQQARDEYTIGRLCEDFERFKRSALKEKTMREYRRLIAREVLPRWEHRPAHSLRKQELTEARNEIFERAPILSNRFVTFMKGLYSYAVEEQSDHVSGSPAAGFKRRVREEEPRKRTLSTLELAALLKWLPDADLPSAFIDDVMLVAYLGLRHGEVLGAREAEFDLDASVWLIPGERMKNGKPHRVFLAETPKAIVMRRMAEARNGYLFPQRAGYNGRIETETVSPAFRAARTNREAKRALCPIKEDFWIEDLRSTMATHLGEWDVSREVIGRMLSHIPPGVTARHYDASTRDGPAREAWARWSEYLDGLV